MNNDFKKTMEACTGACLPCTAWSGETEEIIDQAVEFAAKHGTGRPTEVYVCLLYTSPSPRDMRRSRMPSSA